MSHHNNLDNKAVADYYNMMAGASGRETITPSTVAEWRQKLDLYTYAGRRGGKESLNKKSMQH